jgi:hypothetical protein
MIMLLEHVKKRKRSGWLASASVCVEEHEVAFNGLGPGYRLTS